MLHRTEGIVLKTIPFGEADLIVTYLTPDSGLLKTFAKSPRKIKSRFGSSLEPLTHSRISFWGKEDATLPRLTQSDIIHPFQSIRNTLSCFLKVSEIIDLTLHFIPERDANKKVYSLLLNTLHSIENNCNKDLRLIRYKIKFLELMGYAPKLDGCGRCGKKGYNFYMSHGSILCEVCAKGIDLPLKLSPAVVKFYINLLTWDATKMERIKPSGALISELSNMMDMHTKYILAKPLKSKSLI
ncbi:MAG: DNA repair protein RecO [Nitrospirota bacterium]